MCEIETISIRMSVLEEMSIRKSDDVCDCREYQF